MSNLSVNELIYSGAVSPNVGATKGDVSDVAKFYGGLAGTPGNIASITSSTKTIDFTNGSVCVATYANAFSGSCALTLNFGSVSGVYVLVLKQNSTGSCLATYTNTLTWKSGTAPTLTTTAAHYDVLTFINVNGVITLATSTLDLY